MITQKTPVNSKKYFSIIVSFFVKKISSATICDLFSPVHSGEKNRPLNHLKLGSCANVPLTLEQEKKGYSLYVKFSSLKKETITLTKYYYRFVFIAHNLKVSSPPIRKLVGQKIWQPNQLTRIGVKTLVTETGLQTGGKLKLGKKI